MNDLEQIDLKFLINITYEMTTLSVKIFKIKNLYTNIKNSLNEIWDYVYEINNYFDRIYNEKDIEKLNNNYEQSSKELFNFYNINWPELQENLNFLYGNKSYEKFCRAVCIKSILKEFN